MTSKTKAEVHYEWAFVSREGKPHRVSTSVNHVLHNKRTPSVNPLQSSACSRLTFPIEFFNAVASNVLAGIEFKGIAYESDRPHLLARIPCGGEDVQAEPVYWKLPDGRVVCWSVRHLAEARDDELLPVDSKERYIAVAKELGYDVQSLSIERLHALYSRPRTY